MSLLSKKTLKGFSIDIFQSTTKECIELDITIER